MFLPARGPNRISPAQAHRAVGDGSALLVDVREEDEFQAGRAPAALHLPLSRLAEGAEMPGREDGRDLVLICRSGHRSRQATCLLAGRGVTAVDVVGGMGAWAAEGLPVHDASGAAGTVI
ncbi:rhodanese-like domain-containing protein [Streptomyces microflavus]|uniref:rhodanese-like domain-containing protein n=1 Tax=Streptomyces microflavus TaxID=1919 RepID=UPI002254D747|nr:rhodanese-like domain-containing protein [Streptomyces microflavus]MCX4657480.1 rhodanese-like domain-containing protein [Streptomyces microflavus]